MKPSILIAAAALAGYQSAATQPDAPISGSLRLATWNMGTLVAPDALAVLKGSCLPNDVPAAPGQRGIACDSITKIDRSNADFAAFARYARTLDADVIALEEVDGPEAARQVLTGYQFCFTGSVRVQNTGFAIRNGIPFRCGEDLTSISLNDRLPRGAQLVVYPGEVREMHLLAVHLQYGCGRAPLNERRDACTTLARQVPELKHWIDAQASAGHAFAVLGGFNRDFATDTGPGRSETGELLGFWNEINRADLPDSRLVSTVEGHSYVGCTPAQKYPGYFDQVVLSQPLAKLLKPDALVRITYDPAEAQSLKLANQCPVGVDLELAKKN